MMLPAQPGDVSPTRGQSWGESFLVPSPRVLPLEMQSKAL